MTFEEAWALADCVDGMYSREEGQQLWNCALAGAQLGALLEIGVFKGRSTTLLGHVAMDAGVTLHCVDPFWLSPGETNDGHEDVGLKYVERQTRYTILKIFRANMTGLPYKLYVGTADLLPIDLHLGCAHIDGDHLEGVASDIAIVGPMVVPGGYLIFHDCLEWGLRQFPAVNQAVQKLLSNGWEHISSAMSAVALRKPVCL